MFKDQFQNSTEKLAEFITGKTRSNDIRITNIFHEGNKAFFIVKNTSEKTHITLWFNFEKGFGGYSLAKEFEDIFAFSVDFDYIYIEPNRIKGRKEAHLYRLKSITTE